MRITRDQMLMEFAMIAARRSTCLRRQVGCIIAIDGRPMAAGYAGSKPGEPHCIDEGCIIGPSGGCIRTQHAERNAIDFLARRGRKHETRGADLYCTLSPCQDCAERIVEAGIKKVLYVEQYRDVGPLNFLLSKGIKLLQYNPIFAQWSLQTPPPFGDR